ncbi:hypothetical protein BpHYR1_036439 [Brachionus plicatilis]|uniref:Uncharacterized protein n=1 Tax=Brachionus plicatilis TaxID=10195 RepID=A0A3M7P378_BRAPC|nr:hypothetical protein BpHYR1_036439 [Brachionus plicatilis]
MDFFKAILHLFNTIDQLMFALKIGKEINDLAVANTVTPPLPQSLTPASAPILVLADNFEEFYPINFIEKEKSFDELKNSEINFNYSEYEFTYKGLECFICNKN